MTRSISLTQTIFVSWLLFGGVLRIGGTEENVEERNSTSKKMDIEVFYSPVNSTSVYLIYSQIFTVMNSVLGKYINLKMYPVGSCKIQTTTGQDESLYQKLSCALPDGAKIEEVIHHLCAIDVLDKVSRVGVPKSLYYILCAFQKSTVLWESNWEKCRNVAGESMTAIKACISKPDDSIITTATDRLNKVDPHYYPFLVINGNKSIEQDKMSQTGLWEIVCDLLGQSSPANCGNITGRRLDSNRTAEDDATLPVFLPCIFVVPALFTIFL